MEATIGRIVIYQLNAQQAEDINRRRQDAYDIQDRIKAGTWPMGTQAHVGNLAEAGQEYPMLIVRVWSGTTVNGQVFLDGNDVLWTTSVQEGVGPGKWYFPVYVK